MATERTAEGIRKFGKDIIKLEKLIESASAGSLLKTLKVRPIRHTQCRVSRSLLYGIGSRG